MDDLTLKWFVSFLKGRRQCVKLNDITSNTLPITYGVPQGSILGPILFSLYINDITDIVSCGVVLYADDTVIFHDDRKILQTNLDRISDWCNENLLTINVKKSHWMKTKICGKYNRIVHKLGVGRPRPQAPTCPRPRRSTRPPRIGPPTHSCASAARRPRPRP